MRRIATLNDNEDPGSSIATPNRLHKPVELFREFVRPPDAAPRKRERAILTVIPWDVWAAAAIAAVGIILAVVFDQAPLLVFFLVGLALCTYIAIRNRFGDEDETPVENLDQDQETESACRYPHS